MEEDEAEKRGILCLKSIKVYGTTGDLSCSSNQFPRLYNRDYEHVEFIDHIVTERDTLQGLSLKYDCTFFFQMEDIKRYNQLWSNDSSCVRQKTILRIPIRQGSDKMPNSLNSTSNSEDSESDLVMIPDAKNSSINNENADDFFSRIDSSIQKLKKKSSMDQSLRLESFRVDQLEPNNYGITQTSLISYQNGGYEADC
ncbi:uncharacterized protein LOC136035639 isoform X1 [Artemia franciscana]|uniref:uncharacterized protein LOC136035639 isoform X1 n=1 Tax=Artemia franciscana TaxID=6661 RepID=UPI0032DB744A